MKRIYLLFLLAAATSLSAQDLFRWSDGPLSWDQIEVKPLSAPEQPDFRLGYNLELLPSRQRLTSDCTLVSYQPDGYLQLGETWVTAGQQTSLNLHLLQIALGYVERHRRGLQLALHGNHLRPVDLVLLRAEYMERIAADLARLLKTSEVMADPALVSETWQALKVELNEPLVAAPLRYEYLNVNIGLMVLSGAAIHAGPMADYLRSPWVPFGFGFDFGWKRWSLLALGNFTQGQILQDLPVDSAWASGRPTTGVILNLGIGYRLIETRHWQLTPFVGLGVNEILLLNPTDDRESNLRQVDYGPTLALLADYRFKTILKPAERNDFFVRLRLLAGPGSDTAPFRGWTFGASVGLGVRSWVGKHLLAY
jgi:hypothetical protein